MLEGGRYLLPTKLESLNGFFVVVVVFFPAFGSMSGISSSSSVIGLVKRIEENKNHQDLFRRSSY